MINIYGRPGFIFPGRINTPGRRGARCDRACGYAVAVLPVSCLPDRKKMFEKVVPVKSSKWLSALMSLVIALVVLAGAIAVPILCRPFYYAHIEALGLAEGTGLSREQIIEAYDQVLDYCTGRTEQFSAGILPFSPSGESHFADVQGLFLLDLRILGLGAVAVVLLLVVCRWRKIRPCPLGGHGPGFWAAAGLAVVFLVIGGLAALDFDRAFTIFHTLFFFFMYNWIFDWRVDPVILILPQEFFRNCAVLILVLLLLWCAVLIFADLWVGHRRKRT